jgi:hypothetical protein
MISDMDAWVAIVIGLGSGLVGTIGAALLTIRHEREAEIRSRMLAAAEEYLGRAEAVVRSLNEALDALEASDRDEDAIAESIGAIDELRWSSLLALLRLKLLFGVHSRTWERAVAADTVLGDLVDALKKWREGPKPGRLNLTNFAHKNMVTRPLGEAWLTQVNELASAARRDILSGRRFRFGLPGRTVQEMSAE